MLINWFLANFAIGPFNALKWSFLLAFLVFGLGHLSYSVLKILIKGAHEWLLILGSVVFAIGVVFVPWSHPLVVSLFALAAVAGLFVVYWGALRRKRALLEHVEGLNQHVVMIDQEGRGLELAPSYSFGIVPHFKTYTKEAFKGYIDNLLEAVDGSGAKRILIFVHGGLTDYQKALLLSETRRAAMAEEGIYPIFILWRSGLVPCYISHLTEFRQGRMPLETWYGRLALTIANILADVGRGISRFPKTAYYQALNDLSALHPRLEHDALNAPRLYTYLRTRFAANGDPPPLRLRKKPDEQKSSEGKRRDVWLSDDWQLRLEIFNPLKLAFRYTVWPLIDALGTSAWDIMLRRTHTLFRSPYEFDVFAGEATKGEVHPAPVIPPYPPELDKPSDRTRYTQMFDTKPSGGLSLFIEAFAIRGLTAEVTLVGHSMGAIVVSRWLSLFPGFKAKDVVLMGAACTVQEGFAALNPYLKRHTTTTGHILTLHAKAERVEQHLFGLSPLGSLLEWIDNFFSKPLTFDQRMLGKWDNLIQSTHLIDREVRGRVHLKSFSVRSDAFCLSADEADACKRLTPQRRSVLAGQPLFDRRCSSEADEVRPPLVHGDFSFCKFWRPAFYTVVQVNQEPKCLAAEEEERETLEDEALVAITINP